MFFWKSMIHILMLAMLLMPALSITPVRAQSDQICFPETKQCISGRFRAYWEQNGGLPVFGFPIRPAQDEVNRETGRTYLTQWFERTRFELHPEKRAPYDVLLGRLGDDRLRLLGRDWQDEGREREPIAGCLWFRETGHTVCDQATRLGFSTYWQTHGLEFDGRRGVSFAESLALFGLPLTEARIETSASGEQLLTQWFERARFESHSAKPDQYKVLLGLLGNELRLDVGSPPPTYYFQNGALFELTLDGNTRRLAVVPNLGTVLDVVQTGGSLLALREQGIQRILLPNGARRTITRFDPPALFGQLVPDAENDQILYGITRDDPGGQFGFASEIGMVGSRSETARTIARMAQNVTVLGLTPDKDAIYVIRRGQDPSFGAVDIVDVNSGAFIDLIAVSGDGGALLSPTGRSLVTIAWRPGPEHELEFYDLTSPGKAPNKVTLPEARSQVGWMHWSPVTGRLYATVFASQADGTIGGYGNLWQMNTRAGRWDPILARNIPADTQIGPVTFDGRWLALHMPRAATSVELASGRMVQQPVPSGAIIAR